MLVAAILALLAAPGDPTPWFARLEAATSTERDLAQRRLTGTLEPTDASAIRAALVAGGAETRLRLAHVLGSEERLFGTAAELAVDTAPEVARAALTGLRLAIERFEPFASGEPLPADELGSALALQDGFAFDAEVFGAWVPAEIADLLALAQPTAPRIVFVGDGSTSPLARAPLRAGTWREFARAIAQRTGGRLVGFGLRREPGPSVVRWLAVTESRDEVVDIRASELVERWCLDFARVEGGLRRAVAARSLASHGLPSAIEWLARRFRQTRDDAALEGLLLAARRGLAPAVLQERFAREHLWNELERASDLDGERALHAALALARSGLPAESERNAELARALSNLDLARRRRVAHALVVLEGWAEPRAPTEIASAVRGLLARPELAPDLRLRTLRVAARSGIVEPVTGDLLELARAATRTRQFDELCELLRGAPNWPPDAWADSTELGLPIDATFVLADAWVARGQLETAARVLARELARDPNSSARVRVFTASAERVRATLELTARSIPEEEPATWFVLCGVATEGERHQRLTSLLLTRPSTDAQWLTLADLSAGSTGESARLRLAALLPTCSPELALRVARRAVQAIRASQDDEGERDFLQSVRGAVRADRGSALDRAFSSKVWPPIADARTVRLIEFDRDSDRGAR